MGLDIEIIRCRKPDVMEGQHIDRRNYCGLAFSEEEIEERMFSDLKPYCVRVNMLNRYYDKEKMIRDFDLPEDSMIRYMSLDHIEIGKGDRNAKISQQDVESRYTIAKVEPTYVCSSESVAYWRKDYDVQDFFYSKYPVENCGYYMLSADVIEEFNDLFGQNIPVVEPTEESALFYWEWY